MSERMTDERLNYFRKCDNMIECVEEIDALKRENLNARELLDNLVKASHFMFNAWKQDADTFTQLDSFKLFESAWEKARDFLDGDES